MGIRQSPVAWGRFSGVISQFLSGNNTRALVPFVRLLELYSCVLQSLDEDKAESLYVTNDQFRQGCTAICCKHMVRTERKPLACNEAVQ